MNKLLALLESKRQFLVYCVIGVSGVALDFGIFWLLTHVFGLHYQIANFLSYTCGTLNNFWWNFHFNFQAKDHFWKRFGSFYLIGLVGWAVSSGMLYVMVEQIHLSKLVAKGISLVVVVLLQYSLNKAVSFRQSPRPNP
jgi:putative flippase GtrA